MPSSTVHRPFMDQTSDNSIPVAMYGQACTRMTQLYFEGEGEKIVLKDGQGEDVATEASPCPMLFPKVDYLPLVWVSEAVSWIVRELGSNRELGSKGGARDESYYERKSLVTDWCSIDWLIQRVCSPGSLLLRNPDRAHHQSRDHSLEWTESANGTDLR